MYIYLTFFKKHAWGILVYTGSWPSGTVTPMTSSKYSLKSTSDSLYGRDSSRLLS